MSLKLYIWPRFCPGDDDYGLAFALAEAEEEAKKLVTKDDECGVWEWGDLEVRELFKCGYFAYGA